MDVIKYLNSSIRAWFFDEESLDYIDKNVTVWQAFFTVWIMVITLYFVSNIIFGNYIIYHVYSTLLLVILFPIFIFIFYGLTHLVLKLFGGIAKLGETMKFLLSINIFATIIFLFLDFISNFFTYSISILIDIILIGVLICYFAVILKPLSIIHDISQWKVFFALLSLFLLFILMLILLLAFIFYSGVFF